MKMRTKVVFLLALSAALIGTLHAESIGIATNAPGSMYHSSGTALAKLANERAGISATVQPFASPTVFIPAVNSGELQFGFANVYETTLAYEGKEFFAGRTHKELRAVAIAYPIRTGMYVRKNSPFRKIADLKGHPMPDGYTGQKTIVPQLDAYYATANLTRADFKPVNVPTVLAGADAFSAGRVDAFLASMGGAKVREIDAAVGGIRCLSIPNTPENLAAIQKHFPTAYLRLEKPGPDNPGVTDPVYVVTFDGLLFTSAKVSDEVVYKITKAVYEHRADLGQVFAMFNQMDSKEMVKNIPVPYHPGAIKFYKEKGLWPPK
jgi:TRAP transporter TAXI family solute receptor